MFAKLKEWWANLPNEWLGVSIKKPTTYLIVGFILLLVFMFTQEAKADERETRIEVAPTLFVAGDRYNGGLINLEERWKGKYALGVGLTTDWNCSGDCKRGPGPTNQFIYAQRVVQYKKFEMGLGVSYWHNKSPAWDSHTPFALHLGWNFNDHWAAKWRHFSTGGSSEKNGGLDYLSISYNF